MVTFSTLFLQTFCKIPTMPGTFYSLPIYPRFYIYINTCIFQFLVPLSCFTIMQQHFPKTTILFGMKQQMSYTKTILHLNTIEACLFTLFSLFIHNESTSLLTSWKKFFLLFFIQNSINLHLWLTRRYRCLRFSLKKSYVPCVRWMLGNGAADIILSHLCVNCNRTKTFCCLFKAYKFIIDIMYVYTSSENGYFWCLIRGYQEDPHRRTGRHVLHSQHNIV